jgi:DNA polymerase-3 subunit delta
MSPGERDTNFLVFNFEDNEKAISIKSVLEELCTPGFFGSKKTVVIRGIHSLRKGDLEELIVYLKDPSPDNTLILISKEPLSLKKDILQRYPLFRVELKGETLYSYIRDVAKEKGIELSQRAVEILAAISGSDAGIINSELEKLSLLGNKEVTPSVLSELLYGSPQYSVFTLAEAVLEKDTRGAFKILQGIGEDLEPLSTMGALNWKFADSMKKGRKNLDFYRKAFQLLLEGDIRIKSSSLSSPIEDIIFKLLQS